MGLAEAPRQDVGNAHGLVCLDFSPPFSWGTISPVVMLRYARTAVSRKMCCASGLLLDLLADIVAHDVHFCTRQQWREASCL